MSAPPVITAVTEPKPSWDQHYWRGLWQVQFAASRPDQAAVIIRIDDVSGAIIHYESVPPEHRAQPDSGTFPKEIAREEAIHNAVPFMQAAGGLDELELDDVTYSEYAPSPGWVVAWKRVFKSIRYSESVGPQHATVVVDAHSGAARYLTKLFTTPLPTDMAVQVSPDAAFDTAMQIKQNRKIETGGRTSIMLGLVQPNTLWQVDGDKDGSEEHTFPESRLVWRCRNRRAGRRAWFEIWIDAITGEVRGGYEASLPTYPSIKDLEAHEQGDDAEWLAEMNSGGYEELISNYQEVAVCRKSDKENHHLLVFSKQQRPGMFAAIQHAHFPLRPATVDGKADLKFVFSKPKPEAAGYADEMEIDYFSASGVMVIGDREAVVLGDYLSNFIQRKLGESQDNVNR